MRRVDGIYKPLKKIEEYITPEVKRKVKISSVFILIFGIVLGGYIEFVKINKAKAATSGVVTFYFHKEPSDKNESYNSLSLTPPEPEVDTASAYTSTTNVNATPPTAMCESSNNTGETYNVIGASSASTGNRCIGTFISSPVGQSISISTSDTSAISGNLWTSSSSPASTAVPNIYLYKWDGTTLTRFKTFTGSSPGTGATQWSIGAEAPDATVSLAATDRIVAIISMNVTKSKNGTYAQVYIDSTARAASEVTLKYTITSPNKPTLTGTKDDDFEVDQAAATCTTGGLSYNSKWTCLQGSATNSTGEINSEDTDNSSISGDSSSWLNLTNKFTAVGTASNFGTTPSNTFIYQPLETDYGNGSVRTVVNSSLAYTIGSSNPSSPYSHTGLVLWTSNTDYLEVQLYSTGVKGTANTTYVALNNSGTLSGATSLNSTISSGYYNRIWLGFTNTNGSYQAQYSTDGSTWNNIGTAVSHAGFSRTGLNAYSGIGAIANTYGGSFDYFAHTFSRPTVTVGTTGSQVSNINFPSSNNSIGGAFTLSRSLGTTDVTSITVKETNTVNANANLSNLKLLYDTTNCTYDGTEPTFGTAASFNASEQATVTGSISVGTSQVCMYAFVDVSSSASTGQYIDIEITNPSTDVAVSAGVVNPATVIAISGSTSLTKTNQAPNSPASLTQGTASGQNNISESAWTKYNAPYFGFIITDPDTGDTVKYEIQIADNSTFTTPLIDYTHGSLSASGTTFAFQVGNYGAGSCVGTCPSVLSDSSGGYWWRVKSIDNSSASSSWVEFGTAGTVDAKIDTTAPTGLSVYDGTTIGVDGSYNTGSLTQLSANWSAANFSNSGALTPNKYQYAIGTTVGGTDILTWQATNTESAVVNATSLNLHTGQMYYWTVNAYDSAGNIATTVSNGQYVTPTLSFSISSNSMAFSTLNNGNNWTDTKSITTTTSTNAWRGYSIYAFIDDYMRSVQFPATYVNDVGFTYASPQLWPLGTYGFGYTSNGASRYSGGTLYCAFNHTAPGDIVAEHTATVDGSTGPVSSEVYTITGKMSVDSSQKASDYKTNLYLIVVSNY